MPGEYLDVRVSFHFTRDKNIWLKKKKNRTMAELMTFIGTTQSSTTDAPLGDHQKENIVIVYVVDCF
jgi:hypothetical protein